MSLGVCDGWPTSLPICLRFIQPPFSHIPISKSIVKPQSLLNMRSLLSAPTRAAPRTAEGEGRSMLSQSGGEDERDFLERLSGS